LASKFSEKNKYTPSWLVKRKEQYLVHKENDSKLEYLGKEPKNLNYMHDDIKSRINSNNAS
jgi:hypothetical protein